MVRVYYGDGLARYGFGQGHPFGPDRLQAFWDEALRRGLDQVKKHSADGTGFLDYGDTPAFVGVFEAGCCVVGSTLDAAAALVNAEVERAFVPIAGLHHARPDTAAGFCVFNDIGVVVNTLRAVHGVKRIAYVDIDAHHGDGVFYAFEDDPELYIADIHEDGRSLYPGTGGVEETGRGAAAGTKLNVPLPPGSGDDAFHRVWPAVERFIADSRPEFILLQAGADSIGGDPITHLRYTPAAHAHAAARLCAVADEYSGGRVLALGGGGYNRQNLAQGWCAVVEAMVAA
jgi:acetoin utilization protein AcuC